MTSPQAPVPLQVIAHEPPVHVMSPHALLLQLTVHDGELPQSMLPHAPVLEHVIVHLKPLGHVRSLPPVPVIVQVGGVAPRLHELHGDGQPFEPELTQ